MKILKPLNKSLRNYYLEKYLMKVDCVLGVPNGGFFYCQVMRWQQ